MNRVLVPRPLTGNVLVRAAAGLAAVIFATAVTSCSFSVGDLRPVGEEESAPTDAEAEETEAAEADEQPAEEEGEAEEAADADAGSAMPVDPADAVVWDDETYWLSGSGDALYQLEWTPQVNASLELTHTGTANFIVVPYDAEGVRMGSIANDIGAVESEFVLEEGAIFGDAGEIEFIHVQADGDWTISR
ncbi:hypothetical protein [Nocardiopsis ganjiahuensis]|uniref:hypothetical protein n=1 Tax=Nocardiopsis ganjiahuensis TaxID=239984 RepID=UPI0003454B28|nr:hypothetical protein [Nocardiopsis ganjiahuensis]